MPHDAEYRSRLRMERMHERLPPPLFRDPYFDSLRDPYLDFPPPRDPFYFPRDDKLDMREPFPIPPVHMRDPQYDRMQPFPRDRDLRDRERELRDREPLDRELKFDQSALLPPRSFSPVPRKDFAYSLSAMPTPFGKEEKPLTDMEIIVVNRQQK